MTAPIARQNNVVASLAIDLEGTNIWFRPMNAVGTYRIAGRFRFQMHQALRLRGPVTDGKYSVPKGSTYLGQLEKLPHLREKPDIK